MSDFLKKMKNSLERGEFNSDVADRINKIAKKADEFSEGNTVDDLSNKLSERIEKSGGVKKEDEKEVPEINSEYEQKMNKFYKENEKNVRIAEIFNINDQINNDIQILIEKINSLKNDFDDLGDMGSEIDNIENKFNNFKI